ncbi:recombinase family protein [Streptomyces sp. H27-H5]|uniref:recombinase family protein n=1 Tax=Streptomyces sp. H27-H5 TaxID=2996460 RepID=UPI00226F73CE|nr:recombinase family protein [Streptomyces sp. H27-H5]MCY0956379.1 recombinase family protein [Streptomyces sp. H27-H5]
MAAHSQWEIHPSLAAALKEGLTFEEWLGGRVPVCSYARITKDRQQHGKEQIGVGRQHGHHCDPAAEKLGWAVVYRYTDNHITAADPDITRPAFVQMVRDLRARSVEAGYPIKGLIAVEDERVYRLPEDYLRLYRALTVDEEGCLYYTDKRQLVDVHAESEQTRGLVMASTGEGEVRRVKRRVTRNTRDRAIEGKSHGGPRRFGWLGKDIRFGRLSNEKLDPYEAPYLRAGIERRLAGQGWNTIATWYIKENVPTVSGAAAWTAIAVRGMLTNPAICGYRILNGELITDPITGQPVVGSWETVATPEEWVRLWKSYNPNGEPGEKPAKKAKSLRKHVSSGILRCGWLKEDGELCLHGMIGRKAHGRHLFGNYVCNGTDCRRVSRRMDKIDYIVEEIVIRTLEQQYAAAQPEEKQWYGLATLEKLRLRKQELKALLKSEALNMAEYIEFRDDIDAKISDSEQDQRHFLEEQAARNFLAGFTREKWGAFDIKQKGKAIETVLQAVIVHPYPEGRSRSAPFDPNLIEVVYRRPH